MVEPVWVTLSLAAVSALVGFAWLAQAMAIHWRQVHGSEDRGRGERILLRVAGAAALAVSALLCLRADRPSIAVLVWLMLLAGTAPLIALTLAWRPRWLQVLWPWRQVLRRSIGSGP